MSASDFPGTKKDSPPFEKGGAGGMSDRYANQSQTNLIATMEYLGASANLLIPRTLAEITEGTGASRDQVFRTLATLEGAGWVEKLAGGYVLSPDMTKLADRLRLRLLDLTRRHLETELQ